MRLSYLVRYALLVFPLSAHASMISLYITPASGSTEETGATAVVTMSFDRVGSDDRVTLKLENTTPATLGAKLTAIGLEIPDMWGAAFAPGGTGSYFDQLNKNVSVSPGWMNAPGGYDVMITSDGSFEGGSGQGAPSAGEFETIVLSLGNTGLTSAQLESTFDAFYHTFDGRYVIGRFQSVGPNGQWSDKVGGDVPEDPPVPEPASLLLLAVGGVLMRRSRAGR